jgi:hypothetical protein
VSWLYPTMNIVYGVFGTGAPPFYGSVSVDRDISILVTNDKLTVFGNKTTSFGPSSFNGIFLGIISGSGSLAQAAVDPSSTMVPSVPINASQSSLYIQMSGVSFQNGSQLIINLCGAASSCSSFSTCQTCTQGGCVFCLSNNLCGSQIGSCNNYISSPQFCPVVPCSSYSNCTSCTSNSCAWCLTNAQCLNTNATCANEIQSPQFCQSNRKGE